VVQGASDRIKGVQEFHRIGGHEGCLLTRGDIAEESHRTGVRLGEHDGEQLEGLASLGLDTGGDINGRPAVVRGTIAEKDDEVGGTPWSRVFLQHALGLLQSSGAVGGPAGADGGQQWGEVLGDGLPFKPHRGTASKEDQRLRAPGRNLPQLLDETNKGLQGASEAVLHGVLESRVGGGDEVGR